MTVPIPVPRMDLVPETAPFTEEQRGWLSGFFAAALGPIASPEALSQAALLGLGVSGQTPAPTGPALASNDEAPSNSIYLIPNPLTPPTLSRRISTTAWRTEVQNRRTILSSANPCHSARTRSTAISPLSRQMVKPWICRIK